MFDLPFSNSGKNMTQSYYLLKFNNGNARAMCETCFGFFIVNFEQFLKAFSSLFIVDFEQVTIGWYWV